MTKGKKPEVNMDNSMPEASHSLNGINLEVTQDELLSQIQALEQQHLSQRQAREDHMNRASMLLDQIDKEKSMQSGMPSSRNRESAEFKGREFEERQMFERRFYISAHLGKLYIDPANIPADEIWFWAAKEVRGKDNLKNINNLLSKEWSFVRPHECPDHCRINEYAQEIGITQTNFVTNDASILLKRKKWVHEIERDVWLKKQRQVEESIIRTTNAMSDDKIAPTQVAFNETYRSDSPW